MKCISPATNTNMSTAAELITNVKNFDINKITYGAVKANKGGKGKSGGIYYNGKKLILQFPLMFTWGASEMIDEDTKKKSYSVSIPIKDDPREVSHPLFKVMSAIQKKVLDDASDRSKEWFGKTMTRDVAEALFTPLVKYPKVSKTDSTPDYSKTPSLKTKISFWEDKFTIEIYNMDKEPLFGPQVGVYADATEKKAVVAEEKAEASEDPDDQEEATRLRVIADRAAANALLAKTDPLAPVTLMPQATNMAGLIECGGLWFTGTGFGVTWKLVQAKIRPPVKITGFCMVDDEDEEEQLRKIEERERKEQSASTEEPQSTMIEDDEPQTEFEPPAPEPEPVPTPTVIKKVVKKVVKK